MLWQIFWIQITAYYSLHICIKIIISTEDIFLGFSSKNTHMTLCNMINAEKYSGYSLTSDNEAIPKFTTSS